MLDFITIVQTAIANAISGLITNGVWIILIYWGVKTIVKQVPKWIEEYFRLRERGDRLRWAKGEK